MTTNTAKKTTKQSSLKTNIAKRKTAKAAKRGKVIENVTLITARLDANALKQAGLVKINGDNSKLIQALKRERVAGLIQLRDASDKPLVAFNKVMRAVEEKANGGSISDPTFKKLSRFVNDSKVQKKYKGQQQNIILKDWDNKKLTSWNTVFDSMYSKKSQMHEKLECLSEASVEVYNTCLDTFTDAHFSRDKLSDDDKKAIDSWSMSTINNLYNVDEKAKALVKKFNAQGS